MPAGCKSKYCLRCSVDQPNSGRDAADKKTLIGLLQKLSDQDLQFIEKVVQLRMLKNSRTASTGCEEAPQVHAVRGPEAE